MLAKATQYGCSYSDTTCLCQNDDYIKAEEDCTKTSCSSADYQTIYAWGKQYCAGEHTATYQVHDEKLTWECVAARAALSSTSTLTISMAGASGMTTSAAASTSTDSVGLATQTAANVSPSSVSPSLPGATSSKKSGGLSSSAKIGLAAGIPCGLIAIAAGISLYLLGRHKARREAPPPASVVEPPGYKVPMVYQAPAGIEINGTEVPRHGHEMETMSNRYELPEKTGPQFGY